MDSLKPRTVFFTFATSFAIALVGVGCSSFRSPSAYLPIDPQVKTVEVAPQKQVEARARRVMVSTQGGASTDAAISIIKQGGNLTDAAIAASLAISVERPHSTGLGGGGFWVLWDARQKKSIAFDFRERAPAQAEAKMFLDSAGKVIPNLSLDGGKSVGTPGLVKGLYEIHRRFGKLPWKRLFGPAIRLAREGFLVYPSLKNAILNQKKMLEADPEANRIFLQSLQSDGKLRQPDLAKTLERLSIDPLWFYQGAGAELIARSARAAGGVLDASDLIQYQVKERKPLIQNWKGYQVITMPPPSSGGVHVLQILKMLESETWTPADAGTPVVMNRIAQAMQQAFADRSVHLGDPDFVSVPVRGLLAPDYIENARKLFRDSGARSQKEVTPGSVVPVPEESTETTHLSLMDAEGNAIATTQSINGWFGSKVVVPGTGVLLNNTMDDFSAKPGTQNLFGAVGADANSIAPQKTPLSSMSPTIFMEGQKPLMVLGAPGGTRIITAVAQTVLNYFVFKKDLYQSIASPRIHHQWIPDRLSIENQSVAPEVLKQLDEMGYTLQRVPPQSAVMAVAREGRELVGVSDPRDSGTSRGLDR